MRPTGDRVRETLFNWLQAEVYAAHCLDLFAGTGALGFEALSRGARYLEFVEAHKQAAAQIRENIALLKANARIHNACAQDFLDNWHGEAFNIVFIDPPFAANLWEPIFQALLRANCLAENALIYVESPLNTPLIFPANWEVQKSKTSGSVRYQLLRAGVISP